MGYLKRGNCMSRAISKVMEVSVIPKLCDYGSNIRIAILITEGGTLDKHSFRIH